MIYAIISDIHGNFEALQAVISDSKKNNVDEIFCLGDIVGYCSDPNDCIDLVNKECSVTVIGNHDSAVLNASQGRNFNFHAKAALDWTIKHLTVQSNNFLKNLPFYIIKEEMHIVHSSPQEPETWRYVTNMDDALSCFHFFKEKLCFIGHTHFPIVVTDQGGIIEDSKIKLEDNLRYLINVGSVGQPRDGNPLASYGLFDTESKEYKNFRVQYDIQLTQKKMREANLPEYLIQRLSLGR